MEIVYRVGSWTEYPNCYTREEDFPRGDFHIGDIKYDRWIISAINEEFQVILLNKLVYGDFYFLSMAIYEKHKNIFKSWGSERFNLEICEKVEYIGE